MLLVQFYDRAGELKDSFEEELIQFSWKSSSGEGTTFSASVPTAVATMTISADRSAHDLDSYKSWHEAVVYEAAPIVASLQLRLRVITATYMRRKGELEVSLSAIVADRMPSIAKGIKVSSDSVMPLSAWKELLGTPGLVTDRALEQPVQMCAKTIEDVIMALCWGMPSRCNVSLLPFSYVDSTFSTGNVAIFEDARPAIGARPKRPVYRISADDVIDYTSEAAAPKVTGVLSRSAGTQGADTVAVASVAGGQAVAFIDEDDEIAAVLSPVSQDAAKLSWSDGTSMQILSSTVTGAPTVLGILPGKLIVVANSAINLVDKETAEITSSIPIASLSGMDTVTTVTTRYADFSDGRHYYALLDKPVMQAASAYFVGIHVSPNNTATMMYLPSAASGSLLTCIVKDGEGEAIVILYAGVDAQPTKVTISEASKSATFLSGQKLHLTSTALSSPTSVYADSLEGPVYVAWTYRRLGTYMAAIEQLTQSSAQVLATYDGIDTIVWANQRAAETTGYLYALAVQGGSMRWSLGFVDRTSWEATWVAEDDAAQMAHTIFEGQSTMQLMNGALLFKSGDEVAIIPGAGALMSKVQGDMVFRTQVSPGYQNDVEFSFKVGKVRTLSEATAEKDYGRICIELAQFEVIDLATGQGVPKYTHDAQVMAVGSYVIFKLDTEGSSWSLGKVLSYELSYEGALMAKVAIIVVDDEFTL